jgi:hypothetical protein
VVTEGDPAFPSPTPSGAAHLLIEPLSGPIGTTYTVTLQDFEPDEVVSVQVIFLGTQEVILDLSLVTDAAGKGTLVFVSQSTDELGNYVVSARGEAGSFAQVRLKIGE